MSVKSYGMEKCRPCILYSELFVILGVSGGILNTVRGGIMGYYEKINSYKHVSNFQWVWRHSCLNVTYKKPYKMYEG